jgi:hypothetical protein
MRYLLKDSAEGYKEVEGEPFTRDQQFRPWALTPDGRVVYSEWKAQRGDISGMMDLVLGKMHGKAALRFYDRATSQMRRREFETAMAQDAANHPECCMDAVNSVSEGLRRLMTKQISALRPVAIATLAREGWGPKAVGMRWVKVRPWPRRCKPSMATTSQRSSAFRLRSPTHSRRP